MFQKIITLLMFILLLGTGNGLSQQITFSIPDTAVDAGSVLEIPVYVNEITEPDEVYSAEWEFTTSSGMISILGVETTGGLLDGNALYNSTTKRFAYAGTDPVSGTGLLLTLNVQVSNNASKFDEASIGFRNAKLNEGNPSISTESGTVSIRGISVNPKSPSSTLIVGSEVQFNATGNVNNPVEWSTNDASIASIDQNGLLTGISPGTVRVFAEDNEGLTDSTNLFRINPETLLDLTLSVSDAEITQTLTDTLDVSITDLTGLEIRSGQFDLNFPSGSIQILSVLTEGTLFEGRSAPLTNIDGNWLSAAFAESDPVEGEGPLLRLVIQIPRNSTGTATITPQNILFNETIDANAQSGTISILQAPTPVVTPLQTELTKGETEQFTVTSGGSAPYTWESSNPEVASIDANTGELEALSRGIAMITATDDDNFSSEESEVTVRDITLSIAEYTMADGGTVAIETMNLDGLGIFSYELEIEYDPGVVSFDRLETTGNLSANTTATASEENGILKIAAASATILQGEGSLIDVVFKRSENPGAEQSSDLTLRRVQFNEPGPDSPTARRVSGSISVEGVSWTGGGDGSSWDDPNNWSSAQVPDSDSDVLIGLQTGSSYTISIPDNATVNSLQLSSPNATLSVQNEIEILSTFIQSAGTVAGTGDLEVNGLHTWQGGTLSGSGAILPNGGMNIEGTSNKILDERTIIISADSEIIVSGRNLSGTNGALLDIREDATLILSAENVSGLFSAGTGGASILNSGSIEKSSGSTSVLSIEWAVNNSGSVTINQENATLRFTGSLTDNNGSYHAQSGTLNFSSAGEYEFNAGSAISSASAGTIRFGTAGGDSDVTVKGSYTVNGTTMIQSNGSNALVLTIADDANLDQLGGEAVIIGSNNGQLFLESSSPVTIGNLELRSDSYLVLNSELTVTENYLQNHQTALIDSEFDIFIEGEMTWSGGTMTGNGITYVMDGMNISGNSENNTKTLNSRDLILSNGSARYTGDRFYGKNGSSFIIEEGAAMNMTPLNETTIMSVSEDSDETPVLINRGNIISSNNNNLLNVEWELINEGVINLGSNNLVIEVADDLVNTGTITGSGNIIGDVMNRSGGLIQPGSSSEIGQMQILGSLNQDELSTMILKIGGTTPGSTYDQIRVDDLVLDGTLKVELVNSFIPEGEDRFNILVWPGGTQSGNFSTLEGLDTGDLNLTLRYASEAIEVYDGSFTSSPDSPNISVSVDTPPFQRIGRSVPVSATVSNSGGVAVLQRIRVENFTYGVVPSTHPACPTNDAYENLKCRMERFGVTPPPPVEGSEEEYPFLLQLRFPQAIGSGDDSGNGGSGGESTEFSSVLGSGSSFGINGSEECQLEPVNPVVKAGSPVTDDDLSGCAYEIAKLALNLVPGADCFKLGVGIASSIGEGIHSGQFDLLGYLGANMVGAINCAGDAVPATSAIKVMLKLNELAGAAGGIQSAGDACLKSTGSGGTSASGSSQTTCIGSYDPNDKVGPQGVLDGRYIADGDSLPYVVFFENLDEATAAAQKVIISDTLNVEVLDVDSFSFGMVAWTDTSVSMTPNVHSDVQEVDLRPAMNLIVRIEADLDIDTGILNWVFSSLDPETMEPTPDPLAGFLPPNEESPEGEGLVSYFVSMKEDMPSATEFGSSARIIFDENDPIDTPVWSNTLDTEPPVSAVQPLDSLQTDLEFTVNWSGEDDASGIEHYTIYVSENGGEFTIWQEETSETSAVYTGQDDSEYAFFSRAADWTGNTEALRENADTRTKVQLPTSVEPEAGIPDQYVLSQNYPNPFNPSTTIQYGLPESGEVMLEVYNMAGQRVAVLVNGTQRAGWHDVTFDASNLASGVYIYRLQSGEFVSTRKLILVK